MTPSRFLRTCDARCDETRSFPSPLRAAVEAAVASVSSGEWHPPRHVFNVNFEGETLNIPYRVYYGPALLRRELSSSSGINRLILACLGTRHYDGYLRQEVCCGAARQ